MGGVEHYCFLSIALSNFIIVQQIATVRAGGAMSKPMMDGIIVTMDGEKYQQYTK